MLRGVQLNLNLEGVLLSLCIIFTTFIMLFMNNNAIKGFSEINKKEVPFCFEVKSRGINNVLFYLISSVLLVILLVNSKSMNLLFLLYPFIALFLSIQDILNIFKIIVINGDEFFIKSSKKEKIDFQCIEHVEFISTMGISCFPSISIKGNNNIQYLENFSINLESYIYLRKFFIAHGVNVVDQYGAKHGWFTEDCNKK